ncbi:MAG: NapC/NirT family cytochrome c [Ignavibacteriae bacterium]|nr:NapC/NirT family cytochrome c [Ignavibacteriota bacterium]
MKRIFPSSFYNLMTLIGTMVAGVSVGLIIFMIVLESVAENPNPYMGIFTFVLLPFILMIGLGMIFFGIFREHRRARLGKPHGLHLPQIDLNNPRHRTAFTWVSIGTILMLSVIGFTSFQAYEHTESDEFCGETCHTVMEPEYTAYQFSPHAKVGCVQCHIGSGASYFVKSKLSGSYQVYSVLFDKYPKPIPTPIENLRPAQQTCEQCHWPKHFFSEKQHENTYFLSDEQNTKWTLNYLMKIGGGNVEAGPTSGIHWHMNISHEVTYAALDRERLIIPWIRSRTPDGKETIYRSTEITVSDDSIAKSFQRKMDCIDCHNRPTHIYHPPARSVNHIMALGWIDPKIPNVKSIAVKALELPYTTKQIGLDSIKLYINDYYKENYPEVVVSMKPQIDSTIVQVQKIFSRNYFPEMKVNWKNFNNNIGHLYYPGCFRCHDGKHVTPEGKVLSKDCNTCHTILAQKFEQDTLRISLGGVDYQHPVDIGDAWKEMNCSDCHNSNQ